MKTIDAENVELVSAEEDLDREVSPEMVTGCVDSTIDTAERLGDVRSRVLLEMTKQTKQTHC